MIFNSTSEFGFVYVYPDPRVSGEFLKYEGIFRYIHEQLVKFWNDIDNLEIQIIIHIHNRLTNFTITIIIVKFVKRHMRSYRGAKTKTKRIHCEQGHRR